MSGAIYFRSGARLADQAAPSLALGTPPTASGAIFGELLAVPRGAGELVWIGWQRPANAGPREKLWTQYRADALRSARLSDTP